MGTKTAAVPSLPEAAPSDAPLVGWRGAAAALLASLVLCWPMWVFGSVFVFFDTPSYLRGGEKIWETLMELVPATGGKDLSSNAVDRAIAGSRVLSDQRGEAVVARSFTYPAMAYPLSALIGVGAVAVAQTWLVVMLAFALVGRSALSRPWLIALGAVGLTFLTPLPWFAVFVIPDLLAAGPILFAVILFARWESLTTLSKLTLTALAAFAASAHYGIMPLAAVVVAFALAFRLMARRGLPISALSAAVFVVGLGPALNLTGSAATLGNASVTPLRLPILLARSIEDGPARWYLTEACPAANLTLCDVLDDDIPDNVGAVLWTNSGVARATPAQMDEIRQEEWTVLWRAFRAYPAQQVKSFGDNAVRQFFAIGIGAVNPAAGLGSNWRTLPAPDRDRIVGIRDDIGKVIKIATWGFIGLGLAAAALIRLPGRAWATLGLVTLGLSANAAVFGGLSAPADRYQGRVIWVAVFVLGLVLIEALPASRARGHTA